MAVVELVGGAVGIPALGEDEDVGHAANGVGEDGDGAEVNIRVVTGGLAGGGAVEVPGGEVLGLDLAAFGDLGDGLDGDVISMGLCAAQWARAC